ncbi:hypothetical protein OsJ_22214 [Oryza sativa Japonica Group]|uniref:Uncharacterized protein n=1 Tax=Oryza sativa subsp. japonica TaxID=39947 RepID=A3BE78_ORYSJ|nr:hypothetical protein OsJ_22214 [Oryza sativa Japonica Group]
MVAGRGGVTVGGQRRLARAGRGVGVRPRRVTTVAIEAVAAWWSRRRRSCSGADVELACAALAGSGRPRPVPSPPAPEGLSLPLWSRKWLLGGLADVHCWMSELLFALATFMALVSLWL